MVGIKKILALELQTTHNLFPSTKTKQLLILNVIF